MAFVKLNKLKTSGKNTAANAGEHPLLKVDGVNEHIKQTYLQGVVLGSLLDDAEITENERSYIESLGTSLSIDKQDVAACIDTVAQLETDEDKEEFIKEMLALLQPQEIAFLFIADFEGIIDLNEKLNAELVEYLNYFGNGLFHREDWRDFVWDHEKSRNAERLVTCCAKAADAGDAYAKAVLGKAYHNGEGAPKDLVKAANFFKQSAELDCELGAAWFGYCCRDGVGVQRDPDAAVKWYSLAIAKGRVNAMLNLGCMYRDGNGVSRDYSKAYEIFLQAANKGNAFAQAEVGALLYNGNGVARDVKAAVEMFKKAAEGGNAVGQWWLAWRYHNGDGIERNVGKALQWMFMAANQGNAAAEEAIALWLYNGDGAVKDVQKAFEWFMKAAEHGLANSQNWVGWMYDTGTGVEKDDAKAFMWYSRAAEQGLAVAENNYAVFLENGRGNPGDLRKAFEWYLKSANHGYALAMRSVSCCYYNGTGVEKDYHKWFEWLTKAAEGGNADAQYSLATQYHMGAKEIGLGHDKPRARVWYEKAAAQGHQGAKDNLKEMDSFWDFMN